MGFSRQEYWNGLQFPPWDSPGKNTEMGCNFLLQGFFPNQGLNPHLLCLLYWQVGPLPVTTSGSPIFPNTIISGVRASAYEFEWVGCVCDEGGHNSLSSNLLKVNFGQNPVLFFSFGSTSQCPWTCMDQFFKEHNGKDTGWCTGLAKMVVHVPEWTFWPTQ